MSKFNYIAHQMPYLPADGCTGKLIVVEGTDGVGRSTQAYMLKEWLEVQGYAVLETGWTRSKLIGQAITDAKAGHSLHRLTYCLMYATDLADRLEYQILPALRRPRMHRRFEDIMVSLTGGPRPFDRLGFRMEEATNWERAELSVAAGIASNRHKVYRLGSPSPVTSRPRS